MESSHNVVNDQRSSLSFTFRKKKSPEGDLLIECTGFDVKVYGDTEEQISKVMDKLIEKGDKILCQEKKIEKITTVK
jgi:hypothetical protein